jgi:hypothetical protein
MSTATVSTRSASTSAKVATTRISIGAPSLASATTQPARQPSTPATTP